MANKNLLEANQAYVNQQNFNVAGEIMSQFGSAMDSYNNFKVKLSEDATTEAENLSANAVGVDLMPDGAQDWITGEFDRLGGEIASARASGDKKLVRKLENEGAELIAMQAELGNLLKDHAENKLSGNYSKSADTDLLDLLITGKKNNTYTLKKDKNGQVRIYFNKDIPEMNLTAGSGLTDPDPSDNEFTDEERKQEYDKELARLEAVKANATSDLERDEADEAIKALKGKGLAQNWQKEGLLLSDLNKHIRLRDDAQGDLYNSHLDKIAKQANKEQDFASIKDETQKIVKETTGTTDRMQTALFDDTFLQDGKTMAELWAKELADGKFDEVQIPFNTTMGGLVSGDETQFITLDANSDPNQFIKSNGKYYKQYEAQLKEWMQGKMMQAAENHHKKNEKTYGQLTESEKQTKNNLTKIGDYFSNPTDDGLSMLGNETTSFGTMIGDGKNNTEEGVEYYTIKKWSNGDWVTWKNIKKDKDQNVLKQIFQQALGVQEQSR